MTRQPTTCTVCSVKLTSKNRDIDAPHLCVTCFEEAGLENEHMDGFHDDEPEARCPMCVEQPRPEVKTGHHNTAPKSHGSHSECYAKQLHAKTPAGRAACRKARA